MSLPAPSEFSSQPLSLPPPLPAEKGDSTGGIIPYKNPPALIAYYLGLFSLIPMLGLILALVAIPLGISGLKKKKQNPLIRGSVHAWIGIGFGSVSALVHLFLIFAMVFAAAKHR